MGPGFIIRKNAFFYLSTLLFVLGALYFIMLYDQASIHLAFDLKHSPNADLWMPYITHLGDGWAFLFLALLAVFFYDRRAFFTVLIAAILTLILSSSLKATFNEPRPIKFFADLGQELHQVQGVMPRYQHSFPSGHTTTAFAIWGVLAFWLRRKPWQLLCFLMALSAGISRIYLNMHFLRDVAAGAVLGSFISLLALFLAFKLKSPWFSKTWFKWGNEIL